MSFVLRILIASTAFTPVCGIDSNQKGVFESGKTEEHTDSDIILKPSINWKEKKASYYRTSESATKGIKGVNFPYTLWYNHYIWNESEPLNEHAELSFRLNDKQTYAIIVTDERLLDLKDLENIVIKNAKENGFEKAKVISIEKRKVNGSDVVFTHWKATLKGTPVDFLSYLYSDPRGSVFIHTYTPSPSFVKNNEQMEIFLNGLNIEKESTEPTGIPGN